MTGVFPIGLALIEERFGKAGRGLYQRIPRRPCAVTIQRNCGPSISPILHD